jgi:hypothetical protein
MANPNDQHHEPVIVQLVENPVVPDTKTIAIPAATQLLRTRRAWLIGQAIDDWREAFPHLRCQSFELTSR